MILRSKYLAFVAAALLAGNALAGNIPLDKSQVKAKGPAKINVDNGVIHLRFDDPFHDAGVYINPTGENKTWNLSQWNIIAVDVENVSDRQLRLLMQVTAEVPENADKKYSRYSNTGIALNPGEKQTLRMKLLHRWKYAAPEGMPGIRAIDTTRISAIEFFMQWPFENPTKGLVNCKLSNLRVEESLTPTEPKTAEQYIPFIDEYGQFIHDEWSTKIHSPEDLKRSMAKEQAELAASKRPEEWNKYGGWKNGPQLKATGSFRLEKYQGKWFFVDPEGKLFFSHGLDVISRYNDSLKVLPGKESWFQSLPEGVTSYQPTEKVLQIKYGTEKYLPAYFNNVSKRLEAWGFNSLGDWSAYDLMKLGTTPYTLQLTDYDWKMPRLAASKVKFYDVFDPIFIKKMKTLIPDMAEKDPIYLQSITDPMCIGYFIDNELNFGNRGRMTLVDDIMKCPPKQASKQEFMHDLKRKYITIQKLNEAWKTTYANWDNMLASTSVPESAGYRADANVFFEKVVDQYFRLCHDAVKSAAPNRLYLGCRFISTDAVRPAFYNASKKYCDVLSVNIYAHSAANFPVEKMPDMPMLIGEFHFGVIDRGMFSPSLCQTGITQDERALAYERFMQGVLVHPNFVGAHWFQYRDQPLTGRGDGEAYQLGFVDVTDVPYEEIIRASRLVGENMYRYRLNGKLVNEMNAGQ